MAYRRRKSGFLGLFGSRRRRNYSNYGNDGGRPLDDKFHLEISSDTKKGIFIIVLFVLASLSVLALLGQSGKFFDFLTYMLSLMLGGMRWIFPIILCLWGYVLLRSDKYQTKVVNYIGIILMILGITATWHLKFDLWESLAGAREGMGGGYLGVLLSWPLLKYMNFWGALIVCLATFLVGLLLAFETSVYGLLWPIKAGKFLWSYWKKKREEMKARQKERELELMSRGDEFEEEEGENGESEINSEENLANSTQEKEMPQFVKHSIGDEEAEEEKEEISKPKKFGKRIDLPIGLLNSKSGKATSGDIKNNQEIIRKTLHNFGIPVEMGLVNVGPTVTQYTLRPNDGVKLSKLVNLNPDLALALAAHPLRIEAPIPGKSLVGIEIPNQVAAKVTMGEMLQSQEFKDRTNNLCIALGKDVSGKPIFVQLDKMPHLLIAGATGSGKSVCVNSIIVSLLYQNSPDELKFILVDPKRVELPHYNGIPYLLTPVITDVKKTIGALKWCIVEMEKRFELLSKTGNRNIAGYNQTHEEKMPYIVFVIDELAELMSLAQNDMEAGIVRLAQMARAVGIHLILATQRPSTEVITGLIKANIPARIAFAVASSIDSRTVLDGSGAEKLVGRGDMLYLSPEVSKPRRVQGVFLSDKEITDVIRFIKSFGEADYEIEFNGNSSVSMGGSTTGFSDDDDPLLGEVMEIIRQSGKASASLLQRRLKLGYARAARILDLLEERGIIGPSDGAKPREVFLDKLGGVGAVEFASREHDLTGELRPIEEEEEEEPSFTAFNSFEEVKSEDSDSENPLMDNKEAPEELENIPEFLTDEINDIGAEEIESNDASEDPNQNNVIAEVEMIEEVVEENSELESEEPEPFDEAEEQEEIEELEPEEKEGEEEEEKNESDKKDKNPPSPKGYGEARKKLFGEDEWT